MRLWTCKINQILGNTSGSKLNLPQCPMLYWVLPRVGVRGLQRILWTLCLCPVPANTSQFLSTELLSESTQHPAPEEEIAVYETESKSWPRVTQYWEFLLFVCFSRHFCCALAGTPKSQTLLQSVVADWVIWNHVIYLTPFHYLACRISVRNIPGPLTLFFFRFVLNSMPGTCVSCVIFPLWIHLWHSMCELFL